MLIVILKGECMKKIVINDPIKSLGFSELSVKLHPQVTATLKVKVEEA